MLIKRDDRKEGITIRGMRSWIKFKSKGRRVVKLRKRRRGK
jgi:hypothetical protein